jgi:hypothetical protein
VPFVHRCANSSDAARCPLAGSWIMRFSICTYVMAHMYILFHFYCQCIYTTPNYPNIVLYYISLYCFYVFYVKVRRTVCDAYIVAHGTKIGTPGKHIGLLQVFGAWRGWARSRHVGIQRRWARGCHAWYVVRVGHTARMYRPKVRGSVQVRVSLWVQHSPYGSPSCTERARVGGSGGMAAVLPAVW